MTWTETPIFILSKDRRSCLEALLSRLQSDGLTNLFIIDTGSSYPPMLEFLEATKLPVIKVTPSNSRPPKFVLWDQKLIKQANQEERHFVYTDCDVIPDDGCPGDWLRYLYTLMRKYPQHCKVGLGLRLNDLPDCYAHKAKVLNHEKQFYDVALEPHVFDSQIDTTMALYLPGAEHTYLAIRTGGVYVARHLPWYTDSKNVSEEESYYIAHLHPKASHWTRLDRRNHEIHNAAIGSASPETQLPEQSAPPAAS